MKKIYVYAFLTAFTLIALTLFLFQKYGQAGSETTETHSFPSVVPFGLSSGRLAFFDRTTGKIFIYNENIDTCVFTGQLKELGQPIAKDKPDTPTNTSRYNNNSLKYKKPTQ